MTAADFIGQLDGVLKPASVAVIGASTSPEKLGYEILKNILDSGFKGPVYPINPKADIILDLDCYAGVKDIPTPVDMAVIIIPARFVPQAVQECGQAGVKGVVIITGGFSEAGEEGEALQRQIIDVAKKYRVRIIGPNCQGINNPHHPLCASWPLLTYRGKIALISQSGTVGAAMMDWLSEEHLGTSCFVSMGNRADVDEADLIAYFNQDSNTEVIAAYIEGIKRPEAFIKAVESLKKPLVVLKSGRTPKGKIAAESHTKALAGADAIYESLFAKYGICRAYTMEEFYDFAKALAYLKPPEGNRILFITTSGGAAILATDQAEQEGLDVSLLPKEAAEAITPLIPAHAIKANPIDLTGDATAKMFGDVMETTRKYYHTLGVIFGDPVEDASRVVTRDANELIIFMGGADVERSEKALMHLKGIPVFPTPERGVKALARVIQRNKLANPEIPTMTVAATGSQLTPFDALTYILDQGLPCAEFSLAKNKNEALKISQKLGYPVALKISSPDIVHKSDIGGVKLNLDNQEAVENGYDEILRAIQNVYPGTVNNDILVSKMADPGLEIIAGMNRDPQFGPVVLFGLGGIMVEIFQDVSLRPLPLSRDDAYNMIRQIKGYRLLSGYRGRPPVNEDALVDCLMAMAAMAEKYPRITEIDLNPVLAYPNGIMVVDARIIEHKE